VRSTRGGGRLPSRRSICSRVRGRHISSRSTAHRRGGTCWRNVVGLASKSDTAVARAEKQHATEQAKTDDSSHANLPRNKSRAVPGRRPAREDPMRRDLRGATRRSSRSSRTWPASPPARSRRRLSVIYRSRPKSVPRSREGRREREARRRTSSESADCQLPTANQPSRAQAVVGTPVRAARRAPPSSLPGDHDWVGAPRPRNWYRCASGLDLEGANFGCLAHSDSSRVR
jgi:hypothetical protein